MACTRCCWTTGACRSLCWASTLGTLSIVWALNVMTSKMVWRYCYNWCTYPHCMIIFTCSGGPFAICPQRCVERCIHACRRQLLSASVKMASCLLLVQNTIVENVVSFSSECRDIQASKSQRRMFTPMASDKRDGVFALPIMAHSSNIPPAYSHSPEKNNRMNPSHGNISQVR